MNVIGTALEELYRIFGILNREKLREDWNGFLRTEKSESGKRDVVRWYQTKD